MNNFTLELTPAGRADVARMTRHEYYRGRTIRLLATDETVKGEYRTIEEAVEHARMGDILRADFGNDGWRRVGQIFDDGVNTECR